MSPRRIRYGIIAAVAAAGTLLALPTPHRSSEAPSEPLTLAKAWPHAVIGSMPAVQADGQTYTPILFLDATTSVGSLSVNAQRAPTFVVRTGETFRPLAASDRASLADAVTATPTHIFWLGIGNEGAGGVEFVIWVAERSGGPARQLTSDVGSPMLYGTPYDLQVADGHLHWAAGDPNTGQGTDIRSMPITGGPVTVTRLAGSYAMSAWPWVTSRPGGSGSPSDMINLTTGEKRRQAAAPHQLLTCNPTWCRSMTFLDDSGQVDFALRRPDGSDTRRLGGPDTQPVGFTVAPLDMFEAYSTLGTSNATGTTRKLWLYDIARKRSILVENNASNATTRDGFLFWSTGDNETRTWHFLDLRSTI